jgi:hypothetical protein
MLGVKRDPNDECSDPRLIVVVERAEVGAAGETLLGPEPANGQAAGRAMVLCRHRPCGVLLRACNDHAAGGKVAESCNFLPWRPDHGSAERLTVFLRKALDLPRPFEENAPQTDLIVAPHGTRFSLAGNRVI